MARRRGLTYVDLSSTLKYGFRTNEALHTKHKAALGQTTYAGAAGVFFGANSPRPARASKNFAGADGAAGSSEGSYCSTSKIDDLRKAGWTVTRKATLRGIKSSGKTRSVYVDMPGGWKYAWNITAEEADLGTILGFTQATAGNAAGLIWGVNSPKPPRAGKVNADDSSTSTFVKPQASVIDAALANGYTILGVDYDLLPNATT